MSNSTILWYNKPAENWDEALPVGNGRLGAMIFGGIKRERYQLNEDSVWSGGPRSRNNKSAFENLKKVRELIKEEKISDAEKIIFDSFCGTPVNQRHYMPLGDLSVEQNFSGEETDYNRALDVENAVAAVSFSADGVKYKREIIASYPDEVIAIKYSSDKIGKINLKLCLDGRDDYFDDNSPISDDTILFYGGCGGEDGINFASVVKVIPVGGKLSQVGSFIVTENCDEVMILISAQTNYRHSDYKEKALYDAQMASRKGFDELKTEHIKDYRHFYDRMSLTLSDNSKNSDVSTDKRLEAFKDEDAKDNKLTELYFNFGRYLMISGSREGTLPLNLQGIWNENMWPAWGGRFTININTEMNYWPVEVCNLSELHMPLFDLIEKMRPNGRKTAKEMYNCSGFTAHHNTDLWGDTAPQDLWIPATQWPMGAAWLCTHIWEHYKFTQDKEFLAKKFDTLKESAEFFVDFLIENDKGQLVTCPSLSPENVYITKSGTKGSVCMGPSMDSQILHELFTAVIESGEILGRDKAFCEKIRELRSRLPKPEIGKYGQIQEWAEDYDEEEPGHRHISQLFALYPADIISTRGTPKLAEAARATINRRLSHGGGHTGWSRAWITNMWARLFDGEKVYENLKALLNHSTNPNMFDSHPPFQIDGNFGGTAAIVEALLQSENGEIVFLPARPAEWNEGEVKGALARGGFEVSFKFKGDSVDARITSKAGNTLRVAAPENAEVSVTLGAVSKGYENGAFVFDTEKGSEVLVKY